MAVMSVGVACRDIHLNKGVDMTGYLGRNSGAEGTNDPLKVKCMLFDNEKLKSALIACDLLALSNDFIREVTSKAATVSDIKSENIIITCTHTHSGPASIFLRDCGNVDSEWLKELKNTIVECLLDAIENIEPCSIQYHTGFSDINCNRDTIDENVKKSLRDNQLCVLKVNRSSDCSMKTILVNYACHPTTLLDNNLLYSADYPFYLEQAVKNSLSLDIPVIFINGCCGNLGPINCGSFEIAEELGNTLAKDTISAIKFESSDNVFCGEHSMLLRTISIDIPLNHNLDEKYLNNYIKEYEVHLDNESKKEKPGIMAKVYKAFIHWGEDMLERLRFDGIPDFIKAELKVLQIDQLTIVALPFEAFHDIGLKIKNYYGKENTMVMCYANGDYGYLPSKELYSHGYYETWDSFRYYDQPGPVCEETENIIYNALFEK